MCCQAFGIQGITQIKGNTWQELKSGLVGRSGNAWKVILGVWEAPQPPALSFSIGFSIRSFSTWDTLRGEQHLELELRQSRKQM